MEAAASFRNLLVGNHLLSLSLLLVKHHSLLNRLIAVLQIYCYTFTLKVVKKRERKTPDMLSNINIEQVTSVSLWLFQCLIFSISMKCDGTFLVSKIVWWKQCGCQSNSIKYKSFFGYYQQINEPRELELFLCLKPFKDQQQSVAYIIPWFHADATL